MRYTERAAAGCAKWLAYCLTIGWKKSDLDRLERLWRRYHDQYGNLKK